MEKQTTRSSTFVDEEQKASTTGRTEFAERANRVKIPKPHQPRFEISTCNLSSKQENNPLLVIKKLV